MLCLNFITDSGKIYNLEELTSVSEQQVNDGETKYRVFVYGLTVHGVFDRSFKKNSHANRDGEI